MPIIANPLEADDPTKAKPSDHKIPVIIPRTSENHTDVKKVVIKRPMPDSKLNTFEKWVFLELWEDLAEADDVNEMTRRFTKKVQDKVDDVFPTKTIKISTNNKPWFNYKLRQLSHKKKETFKKER